MGIGKRVSSIDSLKEISRYFSVTIDDLLSSDKLLSIAEKENKTNLQNMCDVVFGMVDICSFVFSIGTGSICIGCSLFVIGDKGDLTVEVRERWDKDIKAIIFIHATLRSMVATVHFLRL